MSDSPQPPTAADSAGNDSSLGSRLKSAWNVEFENLRWRLLFWTLLARVLPDGRAADVRTRLIRAAGMQVGPGTRFLAIPKIQCASPAPLGQKLRIGSHCTFGRRMILEFAGGLTIGDRVNIADGAVILTTSHELGPKEHRAGPVIRSPVSIGNDVDIGLDAIILPGAKICDGARVLANSVVTTSVGAGVTVSGIPARPQREPPRP